MAEFPGARPGSTSDIIVDVDFSQERIDVRRAFIYDVIEKCVILSQPNPPLANRYIGSKVAVTYLIKNEDDAARYGFYGKIVEFISEYELSSSDTVAAIVVEQKTDITEFNVRMHFRIKPGIDSGITLSALGSSVNIIDISIGGAKISFSKNLGIEPRKIVEGKISIDGNVFSYQAKVLRAWDAPGTQKDANLRYAAMQFFNMDKKLDNLLGKKVGQIEREQRFKEMFP
ncbi:MAG: PilZ domain-containing protein [Deltaproteobacteria bacterium]|nr:PilZ domain-containing protein [Deltaproteobacteria bacterium]